MTPRPTIPAIIGEFEQEIARAPRWAQCDRNLLQALIDDWRRLQALVLDSQGLPK